MRLVVVSNRLTVSLQREGEGWSIRSSSGGLVTALAQFVRDRGGLWIGWPGVTDKDAAGIEEPLSEASRRAGFSILPVILTEEELEGFYYGFSNEIIWPLFHDLQSRCNFVPKYWASYRQVTEKFAQVVAENVRAGDLLWIQDYHLMALAGRLRELGVNNPVGFFLHIPFPAPDIFLKLPWRLEVLESLLDYNLIGFQTPRDRANFLDCVRALVPHAKVRRCRGGHVVEQAGRFAQVGVYPIGIDFKSFARDAADPQVAERVRAIHAEWPGVRIIVGVDRLDYTKGILERLKAYRLALQRYPELRRKVTLLQVVVPSREAVPEYQDLKAEIERLVAQIDGEFTEPGWVPVHYIFREVERNDLLAYYRAAEVGFITPLKDGMNLVAKEYCACQTEGDGVLILSEFAGAAFQLGGGAVLVNPYDLDRMAEALFRAVNMSPAERAPAMHRLRRSIARQDVYWWADEFLKACLAAAQATGVPGADRPQEPPEEASEDLYAWTS